MKKQKVAWLHPHFNNWMGGHEYIYQVVKRLKKKYDITIFASTTSNKAVAKFKEIGVDLIAINDTSTYNPLYWLFLPYYLRKETNILKPKLKDYDVVISSYFPAGVWAQRLGKRHIQICYEPLAFFYDSEFLKGFSIPQRIAFKILKSLYENLDKKAILESDKVATLSRFNKNWIKKVYGRDDVIITNIGVDSDFFKYAEDKKLKEKHKNCRIILHSTDFTRTKGTESLLEALPKIIKAIPNIKVLITQTLESPRAKLHLVEEAKKLGVTDKIEFLGKVRYSNLPKIYSLSDLVIQPSINRSTSLSILEAMSCQRPIVTSIEEENKNGKAGFIADSQKPDKIAQAVIKVLTNRNLARKMGQKGREIVKAKFSWQKVADKISDHLP